MREWLAKPLRRARAQPLPERLCVSTPDGSVEVHVRASARARRVGLRYELADARFVLVVPAGVPFTHAQRFAEAQAFWLATRKRLTPDRVPFAVGASVPVLGMPHRIEAAASGRPVTQRDGCLFVTGEAPFHARRITDWLRRRALVEIAPRAERFAAMVERPIGRITLRDTKSRWGSCSSEGDLSFSWRLVMAPATVLDYVVAHEVAHRVEMNHSARFWRVVADLGVDATAGRRWLTGEGRGLHRYG